MSALKPVNTALAPSRILWPVCKALITLASLLISLVPTLLSYFLTGLSPRVILLHALRVREYGYSIGEAPLRLTLKDIGLTRYISWSFQMANASLISLPASVFFWVA